LLNISKLLSLKNVSKSERRLFSSSILVFSLTIGGQFLGFLREIIYSKYFGTSASFDVFTLVLSVILFFGSIFSSIPFFLIPTLSKSIVDGDEKQLNTEISTIIFLILCTGIALVLFLGLFSTRLMHAAAPGFDGQKFEAALYLFRIFTPIIFFLILAHFLRGFLNLYKLFFAPALESIIFNLGIISAVVLGWNVFNIHSTTVISVGYYISYTCFISYCVFEVSKVVKLNWNLDFDILKTLSKEFFLVLLSTLLNSLGPLILMWHGSFLSQGAISGLGYVQRLMGFALCNVVNSFLVVFLPNASMQFHKNGVEGLRKDTERMVMIFLAISVFLVGLFIVNGEVIIRIIFQRGKFGDESVRTVSGILLFYTPWVMVFPISNLSSRIFYIQKDYKTLCMISAMCILVTLTAAPVLSGLLGVKGLALTSSLNKIAFGVLIISVLYKRNVKIVSSRCMKKTIPKLLAISIAVVCGLWIVKGYVLQPVLMLILSIFVLGVMGVLFLIRYQKQVADATCKNN